MNQELQEFIDAVYREPYSQLRNNCLTKSLKILRKARALGEEADLITCVSIVRFNQFHHLPLIQPHCYVCLSGRKVDVSLDPHKERVFCKNSEKITILPLNLTWLRRHLAAVGNIRRLRRR